MSATDLISWVPLQDEHGHTRARYYPHAHMVTMRVGGKDLAFPLADAATHAERRVPIKARKLDDGQIACKVVK